MGIRLELETCVGRSFNHKKKVAPKKTISIRVSVEEHAEMKNISANRDVSIQALIYPLIKEWLDSVNPVDKEPPEDTEPEESK